jgi:predicted transcriptional regulator
MSTMTIRIEDDLKARVAAAAKRAGKTAHAFILNAIAQTMEQAQLDDAFHCVADERWGKVLATGKTVPWNDAKSWIEARSHGERPARPKPRSPCANREDRRREGRVGLACPTSMIQYAVCSPICSGQPWQKSSV